MNPLLLTFLKGALPYLVATIAGFGLAFGIQGLRLTHLDQTFQQYKIDQQSAVQRNAEVADKQRTEANNDFTTRTAELKKDIDAGNAYRRCVAAGKCGRVQQRANLCAPGVPSGGEPDGVGADPVPSPGEPAPEVIGECAQTTLQLNRLQVSIEAQPGYKE